MNTAAKKEKRVRLLSLGNVIDEKMHSRTQIQTRAETPVSKTLNQPTRCSFLDVAMLNPSVAYLCDA